MAKWSFTCCDNSGKRQCFTVSANDKQKAIEKAFQKAKKNARGDISPHWECRLIKV